MWTQMEKHTFLVFHGETYDWTLCTSLEAWLTGPLLTGFQCMNDGTSLTCLLDRISWTSSPLNETTTIYKCLSMLEVFIKHLVTYLHSLAIRSNVGWSPMWNALNVHCATKGENSVSFYFWGLKRIKQPFKFPFASFCQGTFPKFQ